MHTSKPANHMSRTLLLAGDSKNTVLAEMTDNIHRLVYSPYGQQSSPQEVMTHLGFNGELREAKTGWYFLGKGYRVYNPLLMRFHSPDSMSPFEEGGVNWYAYCGCEPVMNVDPTGRTFWSKVLKVWDFFNLSNTSSGSRLNALPTQPSSGMGKFFDVFGGAVENSQKTYPKAINKAKLGKSKSQKGLPKGVTLPHLTSTAAQPDVPTPIKSNSARTGIVLEGNYGVRPQNEFNTVKTKGGLKISGTDSGVKQIPSTSSGIRQPQEKKHFG